MTKALVWMASRSDQKFYEPEISLLELAASFGEISAACLRIPHSIQLINTASRVV